MIVNLDLINRIMRAFVVREQSHIVAVLKAAKDIVRSDLATGVDREDLSRFYPKNLHTLVPASLRGRLSLIIDGWVIRELRLPKDATLG